MSSPPKWILLGKIYREWGLRGHVTFHSFNSQSDLYPKIKKIYLQKGEDFHPIQLQEIKRHGRFWLFKLAGYETPEAAKALRGLAVGIPREEMPSLKKGEIYLSDLEGFVVKTHDRKELGKIRGFLKVGESEVMVIELWDKKEAMVPYRPEFVESTLVKKGMVILKKSADELL